MTLKPLVHGPPTADQGDQGEDKPALVAPSSKMTASDGGLFKLLIIGGGPAGVGVFIRAARTGFLPRLLNPTLHGDIKDAETSERLGMKQKGVAIIHDGPMETFGSGNLGSYIINSNTFARSLLSSVLDEKPELDPPESIKNTFLERAKEHESTKKLEEIGNSPACLVDFGRFLQNVGGCLAKELSLHPETSKCLLHTRATRFERLESGIYRVEVTENERVLTLYAENVVLAMGGKQELPSTMEGTAAYKNKFFLSDECLRDDGFSRLRDHLLQSDGRKVCIVGGSHSSFSVAWLLLNKGKQQRSKSVTPTQPQPSANTPDVCKTCPPPNSPPKVDVISAADIPEVAPESTTTVPPLEPLEIVGTCEVPVLPASVAKPKAAPLLFQPRDITILHRSAIRCYYSSRKDAEADGADGSRVDRTGCVNTFTGLREDSKHLFKDVKASKESRVRLFQVYQHGCQNLTTKAFESANAIVWCCGYSTRMIPGIDEHGQLFKFHQDHGVLKLDLQARLLLELPTKAVVPASNLLGVGLGFSLRSHVDEMGTETRADGVTVYHRRGATLVLAALFGPEVFGNNCHSFEEMVEKNDKCKKKKECSTESSVVDRVKRSGSQTPSSPAAAASSPLRTPSKPISTAVVSSKSDPPSSAVRISPEKLTPMRRSSAKTPHQQQLAGVESNNTSTSSCIPLPSSAAPATNPPVKMLLQRRRSTETLHPAPGSAKKDSQIRRSISSSHNQHQHLNQPPVSRRSGSGSLPKAALLQDRPPSFAGRAVVLG